MMNSSFLFWGQTGLASLACLTTVASLMQFGFPRDTVRTLSLMFLGTLSLMLLTDALTWWGFFAVFYFPTIYAICLGVMGFAWPAFIGLSLLDKPTQLQRKIMWRLPLVGALLGHALGSNLTIYIFIAGWLVGFAMTIFHYKNQRYVLRNLVTQLLVIFIYGSFLRAGHFFAAQVCFAVWIVFSHRIVNALLVKNHIRNALEVPA